jgi:hypothetical protein
MKNSRRMGWTADAAGIKKMTDILKNVSLKT